MKLGKSTREAFGQALAKLGEEHPDIVVLDGDVHNSTRTDFFAKKFPDRYFNVGDARNAGQKVGRIDVPAGMRCVTFPYSAGRIAAQRHDMANTGGNVIAHDRIDISAGRRNTGQMRGGHEVGFGENAFDCRVRALAG